MERKGKNGGWGKGEFKRSSIDLLDGSEKNLYIHQDPATMKMLRDASRFPSTGDLGA
jgi:hypothetical protein